MITKREFIDTLLELNPNMKKVGTSDVWMGEPHLISTEKGFKMVNMTVTIPFDASLEGRSIVSNNGIRIKLWRP